VRRRNDVIEYSILRDTVWPRQLKAACAGLPFTGLVNLLVALRYETSLIMTLIVQKYDISIAPNPSRSELNATFCQIISRISLQAPALAHPCAMAAWSTANRRETEHTAMQRSSCIS
jgi:hypothetical protein